MKFAVLIAIFCVSLFADKLCDIEFNNGVKLLSVPLADTIEQHKKGLSNRNDIGNGMLFSWHTSKNACFWMKNTKEALNVGFFDKNRKLFQIETMQPLSLESHCSDKETLFALELKEGGFDENNLSINVKIAKIECR
ncbi:MAG: DUF192 domain-containing protein [Campylobacteraceae bacterium]|jgi:uncharacterized membrane protein (UPF0127 family)|nr:DUF192 domain-containing protein [Campylobacteraceae bacterium]